jgi:DNA-binding FadR family transcriptional regulator
VPDPISPVAPHGRNGRTWTKPPRLYEEVARDLTESIVRGDYTPDAFLPTEQELSRAYGASRNVVREAL